MVDTASSTSSIFVIETLLFGEFLFDSLGFTLKNPENFLLYWCLMFFLITSFEKSFLRIESLDIVLKNLISKYFFSFF